MAQAALAHLRVVELAAGIAGPYCGKLLAGFGAEVIKVERPDSGDRLRSAGPYYQDRPGPERSIPFLWLNTGKKSVTLDDADLETLRRLLGGADVLVTDVRPASLPR